MNRERWNPLNRANLSYKDDRDLFFVRISKPGPRGGKRPPLWEGYVYQRPGGFSAAVSDAEDALLSLTKTEVSAG